MARRDRLRADFRDHLTFHDAWPARCTAVKQMRLNGYRIGSGQFDVMKQGGLVDPSHIAGFVSHLLTPPDNSLKMRTIEHVLDFFNAHNIPTPPEASVATVAQHLLDSHGSETPNFYHCGMLGLLKAVSCGPVNKSVKASSGHKDVLAGVHWMYVWLGRQIGGNLLSIPDAIKVAHARIGLKLEEYQSLANKWRSFDPWTVVMARGVKAPTGVSIVLPLKRAIYERIRGGRFKPRDLGPRHLQLPSRHLLIECLAERTVDLGGDEGATTRNTINAHLCQLAVLSHYPGKARREPLHLLTFSASPESRLRATNFGYKPLKTMMAGTDIELLEKVINWQLSCNDFAFSALLLALGQLSAELLRPPKPGPGSRNKRGKKATCESTTCDQFDSRISRS